LWGRNFPIKSFYTNKKRSVLQNGRTDLFGSIIKVGVKARRKAEKGRHICKNLIK